MPEPDVASVHLNVSQLEDFQNLPGVSDEDAQALIRSRPYRDWSDVSRVAGFNQDKANHLKSLGVQLGEPASGPIGEAGSGGSGGSSQGNIGRA